MFERREVLQVLEHSEEGTQITELGTHSVDTWGRAHYRLGTHSVDTWGRAHYRLGTHSVDTWVGHTIGWGHIVVWTHGAGHTIGWAHIVVWTHGAGQGTL